jgi:hypothetical protein
MDVGRPYIEDVKAPHFLSLAGAKSSLYNEGDGLLTVIIHSPISRDHKMATIQCAAHLVHLTNI